MCEPMTIMMVTAAVMQGYAAKQQGDYAHDVANYNAIMSENEATRTRNKGVEEEITHRNKVNQLISRQRAQSAASGVEVNSGSAMLLQTDSEIVGNADALRIRSNYQDRADVLDDRGTLLRSEGDAARDAGRTAFATSLFKAAGSAAGSGVADKWFTSDSAAMSGFQGDITNGADYAGYA